VDWHYSDATNIDFRPLGTGGGSSAGAGGAGAGGAAGGGV
jgi:hypothetical protein